MAQRTSHMFVPCQIRLWLSGSDNIHFKKNFIKCLELWHTGSIDRVYITIKILHPDLWTNLNLIKFQENGTDKEFTPDSDLKVYLCDLCNFEKAKFSRRLMQRNKKNTIIFDPEDNFSKTQVQ